MQNEECILFSGEQFLTLTILSTSNYFYSFFIVKLLFILLARDIISFKRSHNFIILLQFVGYSMYYVPFDIEDEETY